MRVLVCCEESQTICIAYRRKGVNAYSCDLLPCSGGFPEWHFQMDAREAVKINSWDLIIAHPPCTLLCNSGSPIFYKPERVIKRVEAVELFMFFYQLPGRVVIENPVPNKQCGLPPYSQIVDPANFGENWHKRTCLWLKNVPPLMNTLINPYAVSFNNSPLHKKGGDRSKNRSKTSPCLAEAIANQWRF